MTPPVPRHEPEERERRIEVHCCDACGVILTGPIVVRGDRRWHLYCWARRLEVDLEQAEAAARDLAGALRPFADVDLSRWSDSMIRMFAYGTEVRRESLQAARDALARHPAFSPPRCAVRAAIDHILPLIKYVSPITDERGQPICACGHVNTKHEPVTFALDTLDWMCDPCRATLSQINHLIKECSWA